MKNVQDTSNHYPVDERYLIKMTDYMWIKTYPLIFVEVPVWD